MSSLESLVELIKEFGKLMSIDSIDIIIFLFFVIIGVWIFNQTKNRDKFIEDIHLEKGPEILHNFFMLIQVIKTTNFKETKIYSSKIVAFLNDDLVNRLSSLNDSSKSSEVVKLTVDIEKEMLAVKNRMNLNIIYSNSKSTLLGVIEDLIQRYQFIFRPIITTIFFLVILSSFILFILTLIQIESIVKQIGLYLLLIYFLTATFNFLFIIDRILEKKGFLKENKISISIFIAILILWLLTANHIPLCWGLLIYLCFIGFNLYLVYKTSPSKPKTE